MKVVRWAVRTHKWVALIVGLQILLWIAGGLVMSAIPIEQVRGEHKIAVTEPLSVSPNVLIPLAEIAKKNEIDALTEASLGQLLGKPVWRIKTPDGRQYVIDAESATSLSPMTEQFASKLAEADYVGSGTLSKVELLTQPPSEYGLRGPVWQAKFKDTDATTLYIDPETAEVRARRSSTWRFYDFFWKLHIMDYDDGKSFNHPLLITAAGAGLFVALSGLILLFIKTRRTLIAWRRRSGS